jgi:O-antigen/teichoic acid export membrane protein
MAANFLNYLFQIIMGRLLNTTDYGTLNALFSIITIFSVPSSIISLVVSKYITEFRASNAGIRPLILKIVKIVLFASLTLLILAAIFSGLVANYINISEKQLVIMAALTIVFGFFTAIVAGVFQGEKYFITLGFYNLISPVAKITIGILLVFIGYRLFGIMGAMIMGGIVSMVLGTLIVRMFFHNQQQSETAKNPEGLIRYSLYALVISICMAFMSNIDTILVKHYFAGQLSGVYSSASILGKIILYIPGAFMIVMFPIVAESSGNIHKILGIMKKSVFYISLLLFGSIVILNLFPRLIISILFGAHYLQATGFIRMITVMIIPLSFLTVLMNFYLAINRVHLLIASLVAACIATMLLVYFYHGSIYQVLTVMSIVYFAALFLNCIPLIKLHKGLKVKTERTGQK